MANTTVKDAVSIHGRNPQYLIETTIRYRIWDSTYWKEHCFALTAETVIDQALQLQYIGGTYANTRPTEFMCLVLKLLQLQPEKEIILEYLRADEFKYLRALAAFYVRLTFPALDVYEILEPFLDDYRKLRFRAMDGSYSIKTFDEFADELLTQERVCEIQLPRLTQRRILEETEGLAKRRSKLAKALRLDVNSDDESSADEARGRRSLSSSRSGSGSESGRYVSRSPSTSRSRSRSGSPSAKAQKRKGMSVDNESDQDRYISRSPSPDRYVSRSPTPEATED